MCVTNSLKHNDCWSMFTDGYLCCYRHIPGLLDLPEWCYVCIPELLRVKESTPGCHHTGLTCAHVILWNNCEPSLNSNKARPKATLASWKNHEPVCERSALSSFSCLLRDWYINKDIDTVDNLLGDSLRMFSNTFAQIIGAIILISVSTHFKYVHPWLNLNCRSKSLGSQ